MTRNCISSLLSHGCPVSLLSAADFLFQSQPGFTCWLPSHCCGQMPERIDFYRRSFVLAHRFQGLGLLMIGPVLQAYDQSSPLWWENLGPCGGQQEREEQGKETVNTSTVRTCAQCSYRSPSPHSWKVPAHERSATDWPLSSGHSGLWGSFRTITQG